MKRSLGLSLLLGSSLILLNLVACDDDEPATPTDGSADATGDTAKPDAVSDASPTPDLASDAGSDAVASDGGVADATVDDGGSADAADGGPVLTTAQARGKYIVNVVAGCPECHTPRLQDGSFDMTKFMAGESGPGCTFAGPTAGDCVHPRNLTNDATGLKNRTDDDIKKMFMHGIRPAATGDEPLFPVMPYYVFANMTDADADAIVAYLRTLPAVHNEIPKRSAFFDIQQPAPALTLAKIPSPLPDYPQQAAALRGKYLATQAGFCVECHSKHLMPGPGVTTVLDENKLFQGGEDFSGILGPGFTMPIVSKNLTSDMTTGLGMWTFEQVVNVLKKGVDRDNKGICPPMAAGMAGYGNLADGDLTDIVHYVKSLPPAVNLIEDKCAL